MSVVLPDPPLLAEGVTVQFGGLRALESVSITVGPSETVGLIGGNGAGKTTFMDCVSGYVQPAEGRIRAFGQDLVGVAPAMRPYLGVGRSYQDARLFPGLSVTETLLVAHERHRPSGLLGSLLGSAGTARSERAKRAAVDELIETMGLVPYREKLIGELSTGTRRVVDLATIVAQRPGLLLLDEPTSGLAQRETEAFGPLLHRLRERIGCSVLLIEHDIVLVSSVSNRVYALESGRVIAEGRPDDVRNDPTVIASYLGTDEAAIRRSGALTPGRGRRKRARGVNGQRRRAAGDPAGRRCEGAGAGGSSGLRGLTRDELMALAGIAGVKGRHRMRKDELVAVLEGSRR